MALKRNMQNAAALPAQFQGLTPGKPHQVGSWSPAKDVDGLAGGRLMITSLSVLTLEVYYRRLPSVRREGGRTSEP